MDALSRFVDALKWGLLSYEGYSGQSIAKLETETAMEDKLSDRFTRRFAHFFGFRQYLQLDEETKRKISKALHMRLCIHPAHML